MLDDADGTEVDIYLAGTMIDPNTNHSAAVYWKNGVAHRLTDGAVRTSVTGMVVVDGDVYVSGYAWSTGTTRTVAKYWRNGTEIALTDGITSALANGITISDGDVYVVGYENIGNAVVATYWKNGTPVRLTDGTQTASASSITVVNGDVYVAGYERDRQHGLLMAKYWKNGIPTVITDLAGNRGYDLGVVVSGTDVYGFAQTIYWKGNAYFDVEVTGGYPHDASQAVPQIHSMAVSGDDIYLVGVIRSSSTNNSIAVCWKNGTSIHLTDGLSTAFAKGIAFSGSDVYVCGEEDGVGRLWKNGEQVDVETSGTTSFIAVAVVGN